jgi:hypothetical protein
MGHGGVTVTDFHGRCGVFGCYFQPIPHRKVGRNEIPLLVRSKQGSLGARPRGTSRKLNHACCMQQLSVRGLFGVLEVFPRVPGDR